MNVNKFGTSLYNIYLNQKRQGFSNFISTWLYNDDNLCFIVDPGPSSTIKFLRSELNKLKITKEDFFYILITYIHIDHAGGVGDLLSFFPNSQVIYHPRGIKHLINPEKLWKGSKNVLGEIAEMY